MISYEPLRILMVKRRLQKMDIVNMLGISPSTARKLWTDEYVSLKVIDQLCEALDCEIQDVVMHVKKRNEQ
jgi:DNA-binding Xre family transcriptional regulator